MEIERLNGEVINIACGKRTSLNQLLDILKNLLGLNIPAIHEEPRKGDVKHSLADIQKAKMILDYEPQWDTRMGLIKTIEFFQRKKGGQ
jgi:nucleoside-diphosphate-sugar epimerase